MHEACVYDCWTSVSQQAIILFAVLGVLAFAATLVFLIYTFPRVRQFAAGFIVIGFIWIAATIVTRWLPIGGLSPINSLLTRAIPIGMASALVVYGIAQYFSKRQ
jgi:hypothetical protein